MQPYVFKIGLEHRSNSRELSYGVPDLIGSASIASSPRSDWMLVVVLLLEKKIRSFWIYSVT